MLLLHHTQPTPELDQALDEALLAHAPGPVLRLWEPRQTTVVLGRSSRIEEEVDLAACEQAGARIIRRISGGLTIVTGPGCLMYAVVLPATVESGRLTVDAAHQQVLGRMVESLQPLEPTLGVEGTSDLAFTPHGSETRLKCSGNSVRVDRSGVLYHGTLLYDFDLPLISKLLRTPPRAPEYRAGRSHGAFIGNLAVGREALVNSLVTGWQAEAPSTNEPFKAAFDAAEQLAASRYTLSSWTASR